MTEQNITITLAPLRGITDSHFRSILARNFSGYDNALAPFISPQNHSHFPDTMLKDILPENNSQLAITPQLLHTQPKPFLILAKRLTQLGYTHINWNLGCPAPQVAKKKKGSGLLPYPEEICRFLDEIIPELEKLCCALSIKMRLGYHDMEESQKLLPLLNNYPLKEVVIHPRLGRQLYKGEVDRDGFARIVELCRHPLVYNGDIISVKNFSLLQHQFPTIKKWMIGRGAIANPFLAEEIKGVATRERKERLFSYHQQLFATYSKLFSGPGHLLSRMKRIWGYLIHSFPDQQKQLKKIQKSATVEKYLHAVEEVFESVPAIFPSSDTP